MILFLGICAALLLWLVPRVLDDAEVVPINFLTHGPETLIPRGVRYSSFANDIEYVFIISSDDLSHTPDFRITEAAPLTIPELVSLARGSLEQYLSVSDLPTWSLDSVSLHHIDGLKWYYTANFRPRAGGVNSDGSMQQLSIPVLLNGSVIKGTARDNSRNLKRAEETAKALGVTVEELARRNHKALEELQSNHDVILISNMDKQIFKFVIPSADLADLEDCDITQALPLTIGEAAATALKTYRRYVPAGQSTIWQIEKVSFCRWGNSEKWYYLVDFRPKSIINGVGTPQLVIPVLSNGEVVQGEAQKR